MTQALVQRSSHGEPNLCPCHWPELHLPFCWSSEPHQSRNMRGGLLPDPTGRNGWQEGLAVLAAPKVLTTPTSFSGPSTWASPNTSWTPPRPPGAEYFPQGSQTHGSAWANENKDVQLTEAASIPGRLPSCGPCPPGLPSREGGQHCPALYFTLMSGRFFFWTENATLVFCPGI